MAGEPGIRAAVLKQTRKPQALTRASRSARLPEDVPVAISIHVQPRASRTEITGLHGDAIKIRIAAPPVDGAANTELIRFVADIVGVPKASVTIKTGTSGRHKRIQVAGCDDDTVRSLLLERAR